MLFAIDHGNSAIKTPSFVFTSGLTDYPVKPPVETDVLATDPAPRQGGRQAPHLAS